MQRKLWLGLLPAYSAGFITALLIGCAHGPKVTVNISSPERGGMDWYDERTNKAGFVPYSATDQYMCFNPSDAQLLLNYCAQK